MSWDEQAVILWRRGLAAICKDEACNAHAHVVERDLQIQKNHQTGGYVSKRGFAVRLCTNPILEGIYAIWDQKLKEYQKYMLYA